MLSVACGSFVFIYFIFLKKKTFTRKYVNKGNLNTEMKLLFCRFNLSNEDVRLNATVV
uniref:Uncharacterized protein n=1 Tax=Anguilla anguilla TaxID=7936 RepID=A0A0E9P923_ANGAN